MSSEKALSFLTKYEMGPETVRPAEMAPEMTREMERGLRGEGGSLAMIPTYLSDHGQLPLDQPVAVIDAGGTNFRRALVSFTENGVREEELKKWRMPGIERPTSWDEFIRFTADAVEPLMDRTDKVRLTGPGTDLGHLHHGGGIFAAGSGDRCLLLSAIPGNDPGQ